MAATEQTMAMATMESRNFSEVSLVSCLQDLRDYANNSQDEMGIPVAVYLQFKDGYTKILSTRYPRKVLLAASKWAEKQLRGALPAIKIDITMKGVNGFAAQRVLHWLYEIKTPARFEQIPQIELNETDDLKHLIYVYQAILYMNLKGALRKQTALRDRILACFTQLGVTKEEVSLLWVLIRFDQTLVSDCLTKYINNVEEEQAETDDDIWAPILKYFDGFNGLRTKVDWLWELTRKRAEDGKPSGEPHNTSHRGKNKRRRAKQRARKQQAKRAAEETQPLADRRSLGRSRT